MAERIECEGLVLTLPLGWKVMSPESACGPVRSGHRASLVVTNEPTRAAVRDYAQQALARALPSIPSARVLREGTVRCGGEPCERREITLTHEGRTFFQIQLYLVHEERGYAVILTDLDHEKEALRRIEAKILTKPPFQVGSR